MRNCSLDLESSCFQPDDTAECESLLHLLGKEPSDICKRSWLEHGGRNAIFPLRSAACNTLEIWGKFALRDVLFSFRLNDALDSLLAAFQQFHIGVSLLNSTTDSFLAFLRRLLYILHGALSPQVVKYRLFISTLCSSGSELCVS